MLDGDGRKLRGRDAEGEHLELDALDLEIWGRPHPSYNDLRPLGDIPPPSGRTWRVALAHGHMVLGPAEAPLALVRGRWRFRLLVKTERGIDVQSYLRDWLARGPKPRGNLKVAIDVDPQSFL